MSELTVFLEARLAEDADVTMTSSNGDGETWTEQKYELHDHECMFLWAVASSDRECDCDGEKRYAADLDSKRRIVDRLTSSAPWPGGGPDAVAYFEGFKAAMDATLRLLASAYRDHPGYQEGWAL